MNATDYDRFAAAYSAHNEQSLLNAHYERPAVLEMAGDVQGLRVLDAGCGSGPLMGSLRDRGAAVAGFDLSPGMIALAAERLGHDADLRVHDLAAPLPYGDGEFDLVTCSLVLHYLADWSGPLAELRRVLRPGGRLVLSVNHPVVYLLNNMSENYFATTRYSDVVELGEETATLTYFHRPLQDTVQAFINAGFRVTRLSEPPFAATVPEAELTPRAKETGAFIAFLFFALERD